MSRSSKGSNIVKDVDQDQPSRNEGESYKEGDSEQEKMSYQDQKQQQFSTGNNPQIKNMEMSLLQPTIRLQLWFLQKDIPQIRKLILYQKSQSTTDLGYKLHQEKNLKQHIESAMPKHRIRVKTKRHQLQPRLFCIHDRSLLLVVVPVVSFYEIPIDHF